MSDDKSKAESQFNWKAVKESIERMKPELIALVRLRTKPRMQSPRMIQIPTG